MCAGVLYVLWYSYPHMLVQCSSGPWKARGVNHVLNANAMDVQVRTTGSLSRRGNQSYRWCLPCWNLEAEAIDLICTRKKKGILGYHGIPWDTIQRIQLWKSHHLQLSVLQLWMSYGGNYDMLWQCVHTGGNWRCWKFSLVRLQSWSVASLVASVTGDLRSFPIPRYQGLAANPLGWSKTFQAARWESRFNGARLRGVLDWHGEVVLSNIVDFREDEPISWLIFFQMRFNHQPGHIFSKVSISELLHFYFFNVGQDLMESMVHDLVPCTFFGIRLKR